jgi:hypothetical protein
MPLSDAKVRALKAKDAPYKVMQMASATDSNFSAKTNGYSIETWRPLILPVFLLLSAAVLRTRYHHGTY